MREIRRAQSSGVALVMIGDLALTQNLHPVRMDVIEVSHQISRRAGGPDRNLVKSPLKCAQTRDPLPFQESGKFFEQEIGTDD
jgi:hypothetical protein